MSPEERAEFEATERDAQLWRYFQGEEYRPKGLDDPLLVIFSVVDGCVVDSDEARRRIEKYFDKSFEGQNARAPQRNRGAERPADLVS
jgi:hypothetical protein